MSHVVWSFLIGLLIGWILTYNYIINDISYRISFYGFKKQGDKVIPYIKLRKQVDTLRFPFSPLDEGINLEVGVLSMEDNTITFTDEMACQALKGRYCK